MKAELDETKCELDKAKDRAEEKHDGIESLIATVSKVDLPSVWDTDPVLWFRQCKRLYCKRPIQCLASSKILTPTTPPHSPASVYPPPLLTGEDTLAGRRGGWGSIFWKTRDIGLASYSNNLSTVGKQPNAVPLIVPRSCCKIQF